MKTITKCPLEFVAAPVPGCLRWNPMIMQIRCGKVLLRTFPHGFSVFGSASCGRMKGIRPYEGSRTFYVDRNVSCNVLRYEFHCRGRCPHRPTAGRRNTRNPMWGGKMLRFHIGFPKFGGASCGHPGRGDPTAFMEQYSFPHWFYGILQVHSVGRKTRPLR